MELTMSDIEFLERSTPGNISILRKKDDFLELLYMSSHTPSLNGMTMEEFSRRFGADAMSAIIPDELPVLLESLNRCVHSGDQADCYIRIYHKTLGFDWVHVNICNCGNLEGMAVFLIIFTNTFAETDLYRNILDSSNNKAYVCDCHSHEILYANKAARTSRMDENEAFLGKTCYAYIRGETGPCENCFLKEIQPGEVVSRQVYNSLYNTWEEIYGKYINWCGRDAFVQYFVDVTEQKERQMELSNLVNAHELQLKSVQILNGQGLIGERLNEALQIMLMYYQADRTYIFEVDDAKNALSNTYERCRDGVTPQIDNLQQGDIHLIDRWMQSFKRREVVIVQDVEAIREIDSVEYAIMSQQDIQSYIEAPIIVDGKLLGLVGADNPLPDKLVHSADLLLSFAYAVGNTIIKEKNERQLQNHAAELETVINNIPVGVSMIRVRDGKLTSKIVNPHLCELYGITEAEVYNADQIAIMRIPEENRREILAKMHCLVTPGTAINATFPYYIDGKSDLRWYQMKSRSISFADELFYFSCLTDITSEKKVEAALQQSRMMYEMAAKLANLSVWIYDIKGRRIVMSDSPATLADMAAYSIPDVIENVPESLAQWIDEKDFDRVMEFYRVIGQGTPSGSCEYWYKNNLGIRPRCERIVYNTVFDDDGNPVSAYGVGIDITAQVEEKEQYRRSIQTLLSTNPDAIGTFCLNLTQNCCSDGHSPYSFLMEALQFCTADEFFENVASLILDQDVREAYLSRFNRKNLIAALSLGENNLDVIYRRKIHQNMTQWVQAYFTILRNPDTGDVECITYSRDITRKKRDEQIFKLVTNQECDYVAILHISSNQIEFSSLSDKLHPKYHETLDTQGTLYDFDRMRQFAIANWIADEDKAYYWQHSSAAVVCRELDLHGHFELSIRGHYTGHPDEYMCRKIQHYYLNEEKSEVLVIETDVTTTFLQQQREAEQAKAEAEHVKGIMDSITSGICELHMPDPDHLQVSYVNQQMFRLLGFEPLQVDTVGLQAVPDTLIWEYTKDAFIGVHPDDVARVRKTFHDNFDSEYFVIDNYRTLGASDTYYWIYEEVRLREIKQGYRVFYATYRDVGEEVRLQEELSRQLEEEQALRIQAIAANKAKSEFLSRMSHDIRTPINAITGMTAFAKEDIHDTEKVWNDLEKIEDSTRHLLSLINDVLDISRAESGKIELNPEPYPFDEYIRGIRSMFESLCEQNGLHFIVQGNASGKGVIVDRVRFDQIAINLLSNAVKYTPAGGTITYISDSRDLSGNMIECGFRVKDTGIGMSPQFQEIMFTPFTQELDNPQRLHLATGTGLGLSIVKRIVDLMGGTIAVQSEWGQGTEVSVRFHLPAATREQLEMSRNTLDRSTILHEGRLKGNVLLAEDNALNTEIAVRILEEFGLTVTTAHNGQEAVDLFTMSHCGDFVAVLLDIQMPLMNGYEAARTIRSMNRPDALTTPIIAMTADAFASDVQRCRDVGMNGHIAKPIDTKLLYLTLLNAIEMA